LHFTSIKLSNFRNISQIELKPSPYLNLIVGDNGAGKTSILEAIFYACTARSFRGATDDILKRRDADVCRIEVAGIIDETDTTIEMAWDDAHKRQIKVDGVRLQRVADLFEYFHAVSFIPEDTDLIFGSPGVRRKLLDLYLSQAERGYLADLLEYNRIMAQRNALLKEFSIDEEPSTPLDSLEIWDSQLASVGSRIIAKRVAMIATAGEKLAHYYRSVESGESLLTWKYESTIVNGDDIKTSYLQKLAQSRRKDFYFGSTSVGPHRDDLRIVLNEKFTRDYASQGEAKSVTLAIKFTIFDFLSERLHGTPILLLDELSSDLDTNRLLALTKILPKLGQVFLSTTKPAELLQGASIESEFKIANGALVSGKA
jgi:DNA replication and repair protein RecF